MSNAGAWVIEREGSTGGGEHRREHELWLAMQAAHDHWTKATVTLGDLIGIASSDDASPDECLWVAKAAEDERRAFETYIEARLAFSEFLLTRDSATENPEPRTTSKRTLLVAAIVVPVVFGLPYLVHERKQVRELDAARDAISTLRNQASSQTADRKQDAAPPQITPAPATAVRTPVVTGHWRRVGTPPPQQPKRVALQRAPQHNVEFRLAPSPRYAHLGPIRVSLQNVDQKHDCFDLSVMLGDFRLDRKHVRRYEPVWINLGGNSGPIRLIADRIGRNEVHGYLGTPAPKPPASPSQRIKNAGSSTRAKSLAQSPASRQPNGG
jgi:hypothetical protein